MKRFTPEEDQFIKDNYLTTPASRLSKMLNRSKVSVPQRMKLLGLIVPEETIARFKADSFIKKGSEPFNKGKSMSEWMPPESIQNCKKTQFRKGQLPKNTRSDFEISKRIDKCGKPYLFIRVGLANWIPLQRYVWERSNGAIPEAHNIIFKDGNSLNCNIENLDMVSNAGLMLRNSAHRFGPDIFKVIQLRGALNRQINKRLKQIENEK